jgi:predicted branched-subunit amino acid permease
MINKEFFFRGFKSILKPDSPAIALGCCFIAIGALLKNLGFNIQESVFSTMLTYALPGSLVMAESLLVGASLLNIFLAVWFVNARLYPMAVSLFPLMMHKSQPKWKYYFSCQIASSVILGLLLGPIFYFLSPEWSILLGGLVGGTIAYLIGEFNVN